MYGCYLKLIMIVYNIAVRKCAKVKCIILLSQQKSNVTRLSSNWR